MDAELKNYLDEKFESLVTQNYLKRALKPYARKDDLKTFATKDDLKEALIPYATKDDLKAFATKDDLKNEIKSLYNEIEAMEGRLNTTINELGEAVNETVAVPLQRLIESFKDYPLIRGDVSRIKQRQGL